MGYDVNSEMSIASVLLAFGVVAFILLVIGVALYILAAFGLYRLAEKQGVDRPWFAFIPILQFYTLGKVTGEVKIGSYVVPRLEIVLPIGFIAQHLPLVGWIIWLLWTILLCFVLYFLFVKYRADKAAVMLIVSIITLGIAVPIYLFMIRNDELTAPSKVSKVEGTIEGKTEAEEPKNEDYEE